MVQEIDDERCGPRAGVGVLAPHRSPIDAFADIVEAMWTANSVVAIRYHNILASLLLGKPTIALAYALKQEALMGEFGLEEFCFPARFFDHA